MVSNHCAVAIADLRVWVILGSIHLVVPAGDLIVQTEFVCVCVFLGGRVCVGANFDYFFMTLFMY